MDDTNLIDRVLNNDDTAKEILIQQYYDQIYYFVFKSIHDKDLSYDITQDIFMKVIKNLHKYDQEKASFKTWLYKISSNTVLSYFNSKLYKGRIKEDIYDETTSSLSSKANQEDEMIESETSKMLLNAISSLKKDQQKVILLHYYSDLSFNEISESLQIPLQTVYFRKNSAITKLKTLIKL